MAEQSIEIKELSDNVELQVGHIVKGIVDGGDKKMIRVLLGSKVCFLHVSEL